MPRFTRAELTSGWQDDHCLQPAEGPRDLLPAAPRRVFLDQLRARLTPDVLCGWIDAIAEPELAHVLRVEEVVDGIFDRLHA